MLDSEFACAFPTAQHPETAVFITREGAAVPADQFFVAHFTFFDVSRLRPGGIGPRLLFPGEPQPWLRCGGQGGGYPRTEDRAAPAQVRRRATGRERAARRCFLGCIPRV